MTPYRYWLTTGAAVVAALGVGFAAARMTGGAPAPASPPTSPEAHADDHDDEDAPALVALTPEQAARAGVAVVAVERGGGGELKLPGRVAFAPGAEAAVDAPLSGAVTRVHVGPGDRVARGQALVTLRSPDGAASQADADAAAAAAEAARAAHARDRSLFDRGWIAQARLDVSAAELRRAEAELRAARARAGAYGGPGADGTVVVRSPIAGVVTRLSAAPGQFLHEEALQVAMVGDPRRVELVFDAPPAAAALVRAGDRLSGSLAGAEPVAGTVVAIAPAGGAGVVVIRARPDGEVPPVGAVISARLRLDAGAGAPVVPAEAVQTVEGRPSVFVAEDGGFRARPVTTGRTVDGRIEILSGLEGGERVAGAGAFLLKAELAKGDADHGH